VGDGVETSSQITTGTKKTAISNQMNDTFNNWEEEFNNKEEQSDS